MYPVEAKARASAELHLLFVVGVLFEEWDADARRPVLRCQHGRRLRIGTSIFLSAGSVRSYFYLRLFPESSYQARLS